MGGQGSGRPPGVAAIVKRFTPQITPVIAQPGNLTLPPTIHLQEAAKKGTAFSFPTTDGSANQVLKTDGSGTITWQDESMGAETDPVFMALSGSFITSESDPVFMSLSGSLPYLESGDNVSELVNDASYLTSYSETDPIFMSLSGSLNYVATEADPVFMSLSGSLNYVATETDPIFMSLSGSFFTASSDVDHDATTNFVANEHIDWTGASAGTIHSTNYVDNDTTDHTALSNIGTTTHANIDTHIASGSIHFLESAISHTNITNIGTNTHAQIDTHIASGSIHFTAASIDHDALTNFVANEHLDWTADLGATNINNANITGLPIANTALVAGTNITLSTNTLNVDDAFLVNNANDITTGSVKTTGDFTTSGSEMFRNALIGTEATPPTASSVSQGTLYVQYTA